MRVPQADSITRWLRSLTTDAGREARSDADLLRRFAIDRDEAAFLALLRRHGPMVLGVCMRLLRDPHAAEDAFQATFLVLLQKGPGVARGELLANWLYGVAYRIAMQARRAKRGAGQRGLDNMPAREPRPPEAAMRQELQRVVDEEIQRLPANYRRAVVLCYLQGQTYAEAARQLDCPPGTVASWLARARQRLRARLGRRGLAVPGAVLGTLLASDRMTVAVPATLAGKTLAAAGLLLAGHLGSIAANVLTLFQGVSRTMLRTKLGFLAVLLLSLFAGGIYVLHSLGSPEQKTDPGKQDNPGPVVAGPAPVGRISEKTDPGKQDSSGKSQDFGSGDIPSPAKKPAPPNLGDGRTDPPSKPTETSQAPKLSGFTVISLTGAGKVTVRQTGKESVTIQGDKTLAAGSIARVEKDTLVLVGACANPGAAGLGQLPGFGGLPGLPGDGGKKPAAGDGDDSQVEFVVEVKELHGLILTGLGSMDAKQLNTKQLSVTVAGRGDLTIAGKAEVLQLTVTGTGNFLGSDLVTGHTTVQHTGMGKAVVNASKQLDVNIVGNGTVEYVGSPQVRRSVLGLGSVTKKR
jgi:RNA polymerase sigma factor (sigma-70 family)